MLISDFAIKKPLITVVSMLALAVSGVFAFFQLKTDEFPEVSPPVVMTTIIYPGASPDQVERELLDPIEEAKPQYLYLVESGAPRLSVATFDNFL